MNKIEKIVSIIVVVALTTFLNLFACERIDITSKNHIIYFLIYSLIPYFLFGLFSVYVKNRPIIYLTGIFMLAIDYLMKYSVNPDQTGNLTKLLYTWVLLTPLLLITLLFIVLVLYITISWFYKKQNIVNINFQLPTKIQFDDEELGKFVLVILSIGFLVNFQNIINLSTMLLGSVLGYSQLEPTTASNILFSVFGMIPYIIFVVISYMVNSRGISYLVGFIAITFDIYLKIISQLFLNSGLEVASDFSAVVNSVFNPLTISLFIPAAFAVLIFGKKLFEKK